MVLSTLRELLMCSARGGQRWGTRCWSLAREVLWVQGGAETWGWVAEACRYREAKNSPPLALWPICNYWDSS